MNEEARVYKFINRNPHCNLTMITQKLELSTLEALYYLALLEDKNKIICRQAADDEPRFYVPVQSSASLARRPFLSRVLQDHFGSRARGW